MTAGPDAGGRRRDRRATYDAPPDDTGEAIGLPPCGLTITFGFGPSLFRDGEGKDRFGLADRQPAALRDLPHFPGDNLDPARSDGDLCVQACADDPQVAVHAIRNLARIGFGTVVGALVAARLRAYVVHLDQRRRRRATCSASRTAPPTSRPRRPRRSTSTSGSARTTTRRRAGWPAAPTSWRAGST